MTDLAVSSEKSVAIDIGAVLRDIELQSRHHAILSTDLWVDRSVACIRGMVPVYTFLRSRNDSYLTQKAIKDNFGLDVVEAFAWDQEERWMGAVVREEGYFWRSYGAAWNKAVAPLQMYIQSIAGYEAERRGRQLPQTKDQYQFTVRQLARLWCERQRKAQLVEDHRLPEADTADRILMLEMCRKGGKNEDFDHRGKAIRSGGHSASAGGILKKRFGL